MAGVDSNGSDQDEAPKQRARDLNMDELERSANITGNVTKNWIWALIGVVVVAGGVAAGVVLSRDKAPPPTPEPTPSPTYPPTRQPVIPTWAPTFPTPEPTPEPTYPPTPSPVTEQPTDDPTLDPTAPLTDFPTISYTPSVVDLFLSGLPPYSIDLADNDPASAQANAMRWLQADPLYNEYLNVYRLNQRYALAVLYYSTNGDSWRNRTGWLSDENECNWYWYTRADVCSMGFRLSTLDLHYNGLQGSIPTEVELLTDLETMYFWENADLSVVIYSELYVILNTAVPI
jgi:hypothetical protein